MSGGEVVLGHKVTPLLCGKELQKNNSSFLHAKEALKKKHTSSEKKKYIYTYTYIHIYIIYLHIYMYIYYIFIFDNFLLLYTENPCASLYKHMFSPFHKV